MGKLDILESISLIRNYTLQNVFLCYICQNQNDPYYNITTCLLHNGLHQFCMKGHITEPYKKCSRCGTSYPFNTSFCSPCEIRLERIVKLQGGIEGAENKITVLKYEMRKNKKLQRNDEIHEQENLIGAHQLQLNELNNQKPALTLAGEITRGVDRTLKKDQ